MSPIEHLVTSGTFSLDGGTWEVENNVWIVGDEREVMLIDPAHDAEAVAKQADAVTRTLGFAFNQGGYLRQAVGGGRDGVPQKIDKTNGLLEKILDAVGRPTAGLVFG